MITHRIDKLNKEFLRRISEILGMRIKNDYVKNAILTNVKVSRDLGHARVFYTMLNVDEQEQLQTALESVGGIIRSILGREMKLRTIPQMHFIYDDSEAKAREMDALLERVAARDAELAKGY